LDGAIDEILIAIVKRQSPDTFRFEETFLGSSSSAIVFCRPASDWPSNGGNQKCGHDEHLEHI